MAYYRDEFSNFYYKEQLLGNKDDPVFLFIHGAGGSSMHFPSQLLKQNKKNTCALDLPGHGLSSGKACKTIEEYADVLLRFIEKQSYTNIIIVGHSMGGAIAQAMLLASPQSFKALVLMASGASLPVSEKILQLTSSEDTKAKAAAIISRVAYGRDVNPGLKKGGLRQLLGTPAEILHNDFSACTKFNYSNRIKEIKIPVLLLCGQYDMMVPYHLSEKFKEIIPEAELKIISGAGHMLTLEKVNETSAALYNWSEALI